MNLYPSVNESRKSPMFLRQAQTIAKAEDGREYELTTNIAGGHPIIQSKQTGRKVTFSWPELIALAVEAGIDAEGPIAEQGVEIDLTLRSPEGRPLDLPVERRGEDSPRSG